MGEVFAGRYELADPIGRGGVGAVWRAWDHRRRRYVAAKVLLQSDAHSLLRFVREQALRIDHPHVLAPASWAADDDKVLFTMDLVSGGSLVHLIGDYGPLPPVFVCTLLDQLLAGLAAVHAEGVVHRDIKPANILLEATGTGRPRLRLSDFGIAMRLGEPRLTETNLVVGTPGYLAPEQMLGAEPDFPADLFAVGLVALYLLEGAKPDAKALIQYFAAHGTPSAPQSVPEPLWQVVASLLQPDPQARFRTATGARKALAAARELLPEPGPEDDPIEIFDQLGPLPPGFAPEGPLKQAPGVDPSRTRIGGSGPGYGSGSGGGTGFRVGDGGGGRGLAGSGLPYGSGELVGGGPPHGSGRSDGGGPPYGSGGPSENWAAPSDGVYRGDAGQDGVSSGGVRGGADAFGTGGGEGGAAEAGGPSWPGHGAGADPGVANRATPWPGQWRGAVSPPGESNGAVYRPGESNGMVSRPEEPNGAVSRPEEPNRASSWFGEGSGGSSQPRGAADNASSWPSGGNRQASFQPGEMGGAASQPAERSNSSWPGTADPQAGSGAANPERRPGETNPWTHPGQADPVPRPPEQADQPLRPGESNPTPSPRTRSAEPGADSGAYWSTHTTPPAPTGPPSVSGTGGFHQPSPQSPTSPPPEHQQRQEHHQPPHPQPHPAYISPHDPTPPTHVLPSPNPHPHAPRFPPHQPLADVSTASYTAQTPQVPPPARAISRARRSGPPAKVAIPLLLLALACYAVGFWALAQI
ncbi:Serine/threonine-protein kinase PrkC [Streptomyces griseorubiginosus]|uniref:non-specific serine/threonine protein kinase n=1 Tax=Streptomyces griseorubiginosus TaxID=67304 RepID=A0AAI8PPD7_9ACTN|nr:serine/threonine-protein kinase [Streptomyces griseorubiginosus]AYC39995.1 Serine/threonine-protein kinase PrkC [Streptomyces griseorubiginosus]